MPVPQMLTDEQAAAIWSGDTASIINFEEKKPLVEDKVEDTTEVTPTTTTTVANKGENKEVSEEDLDGVFAETDDDEDDQQVHKSTDPQATTNTNTGELAKKPGRKPTDVVNLVNQLVEEDILFGFEEGDVKTIEEAKELIKENLSHRETVSEDKLWEKKIQSYSPQIQAILHYAEQGGQDVTPLIQAISEVERSADITLDTDQGQEEIIRQVLKVKGFDDEEINDQIDTLKDLGRLEAKAKKFKPELDRLKEQRIQMMMHEQSQRAAQAEEAARVYIQTIQHTLDKDQVGSLKLKREDKAKIIEALAVPRYRSINGFQVNEFVKSLEEMQFGKNADYDHFLNIVHFAVDKQGFLEKMKETLTNDLTADTVRKLKTSKTTSANTSNDNTPPNNPRKNVIQKSGFKNPYAK